GTILWHRAHPTPRKGEGADPNLVGRETITPRRRAPSPLRGGLGRGFLPATHLRVMASPLPIPTFLRSSVAFPTRAGNHPPMLGGALKNEAGHQSSSRQRRPTAGRQRRAVHGQGRDQ